MPGTTGKAAPRPNVSRSVKRAPAKNASLRQRAPTSISTVNGPAVRSAVISGSTVGPSSPATPGRPPTPPSAVGAVIVNCSAAAAVGERNTPIRPPKRRSPLPKPVAVG